MADKDNSARIEDILKEIRELKEQHKKRAATGEFFNVFLIDGVKINEDTHSAILADLLDPNGSHRRRAIFLKHFLNLESLGLADSFDYSELEVFHVKRKANGKYGEIDVLLEKKYDACIIIENKIHDARDRCSQLNRYYRNAKEKGFTDDQIKLIYLTLDGKPPSEKSLRGVDGQEALDVGRVIRMSYKSAIVEWLENCLKEVKTATKTNPIREVLFQYQEHIKNLTGLSTKEDCSMDNKIINILANNYDLIPELENSIPKAKEHIQDKFWEELAKKITQVCGPEVRNDMERAKIFRVSGCKSRPSFEIALMVQLEPDKGVWGVWYGFVLLENGSQVWECEEEQFKRYVDLVHNALGTEANNEQCLGWKYLKDRNEENLFSDFGADQMRYIAEDDELEKTVKTFAQEIKDAVDKFVKAKEEAGL